MYEVDNRDQVVELTDVPQSSVGAPLPVVVADEWIVQLAYLAENRDPEWDGTSIRIVDQSSDESVVLVSFQRAYAWFHGPPNDEAFTGHPLAARGLHPYAVFRVDDSSWVRRLERMNSVHRHHKPEAFDLLNHYVFAFHDSTFECVAHGFTTEVTNGPLASVALRMAQALKRKRSLARPRVDCWFATIWIASRHLHRSREGHLRDGAETPRLARTRGQRRQGFSALFLVVVTSLKDHEVIVEDAVDESVLIGDSSRPRPGDSVLEWLRFPDSR
jgi:hypothetical protein